MLLLIVVIETRETLLTALMILAIETIETRAIGLLWPYTILVLVRWVACVVPTTVINISKSNVALILRKRIPLDTRVRRIPKL